MVVLDMVTNENTSEYCDFVKCCNCDRVMLVNLGEDIILDGRRFCSEGVHMYGI